MSDRTTEPAEFRANQEHDHAIASLTEGIAGCICGWQSEPQDTPEATRREGLAHLALKNVTLRELLAEIERRDDIQEAMAGLSAEDRDVCRRAAAAAAAETVLERSR